MYRNLLNIIFKNVLRRIKVRATSQAPKRQARRGSQLVLMNLLTFLFQHLSSDLEYFYLEAAGLQKDRRGL